MTLEILKNTVLSVLDKNGNPSSKKKSSLTEEQINAILSYSNQKDLNAAMYFILTGESSSCVICQKPTAFHSFKKGFRKTCSTSCAGKLGVIEIERKNMELYGVKHHNQLPDSNIKRAETNKKKYGASTFVHSEIGKERVKETMLERYGEEHHMKSKDFISSKSFNMSWSEEKKNSWLDKTIKTNKEKYDSEWFQSTDYWKQKVEESLQKKYDVSNVSMIPEVANKISESFRNKTKEERDSIQKKRESTSLTRYGVRSQVERRDIVLKQVLTSRNHIDTKFVELVMNSKVDELKEYLQSISDSINQGENCRLHVARKLGYSNASCLNGILRKFGLEDFLLSKGFGYSAFELEIRNYIKSLGIETSKDRKILSGKEIDIFCQGYNFGIEANGVYTHSENQGKDKFYHYEKSKICSDNGIKLFHIYDDEWQLKQEIIKGMIRSSLGLNENKIHARKCEVRKVSYNDSKEFLNENHIQGFAIGQAVSYGLYYNDELFQIMTFSKPRFNSAYDWELLRSCVKINHSVNGGVTKLFNHFVKENSPKNLICYSDARFGGFGKTVYDKFMKLEYVTSPGWRAAEKNKQILMSRSEFTKDKMKQRHQDYDDALSVLENMNKFAYLKVWDVGQKVYSWKP